MLAVSLVNEALKMNIQVKIRTGAGTEPVMKMSM